MSNREIYGFYIRYKYALTGEQHASGFHNFHVVTASAKDAQTIGRTVMLDFLGNGHKHSLEKIESSLEIPKVAYYMSVKAGTCELVQPEKQQKESY